MKDWDPARIHGRPNKLKTILRFIRIEHTFLSLPMAYSGAFIAVMSLPSISILILIFFALFFLRVAGMTMDNIVDLEMDARNPRTRGRPLVTGAMSLREAWSMLLLCVVGFFITAFLINYWALLLSPFVAAVVISYPYVKKYTYLGSYHIALIEALSMFSGAVASAGGSIERFTSLIAAVPWLLVLSTLFWAVGFDLYNHIIDIDFDRNEGVKSLTVLLSNKALPFAGINQILSVVLAFLADYFYRLGLISYSATIIHGLVMAYAYNRARKGDYGSAFNNNILASIILGVGICIDIAIGRPWV